MTTKELCKKICEKNWVAVYHPRMKEVMLNGQYYKENIARGRMFEMLASWKPLQMDATI